MNNTWINKNEQEPPINTPVLIAFSYVGTLETLLFVGSLLWYNPSDSIDYDMNKMTYQYVMDNVSKIKLMYDGFTYLMPLPDAP